MEASFSHVPVMLTEVVSAAKNMEDGLFLDATLGGAGHSRAVLESNGGLKLIGIDQDEEAIATASTRLSSFNSRVEIVKANFSQVLEVLAGRPLVGYLFDLGVSSYQLDTAERGFAYRFSGPLDMRMDISAELSAADVVNGYSESELRAVISDYSDEKFAGRIARAIVEARPVLSTDQLAEIVIAAIPHAARRKGGNPAKRTFQAIRIEVNDELDILAESILAATNALQEGGKGLVITYHSGEDRIVKSVFSALSMSTDPPGLPKPVDIPSFKKSSPQVIRPSEAELTSNSRSQSARLRVIERVAA